MQKLSDRTATSMALTCCNDSDLLLPLQLSQQTIDLTSDNDRDDDNEEGSDDWNDVSRVSWSEITPNEKSLWKNVPWWSLLHRKPRITPLHGVATYARHIRVNKRRPPLMHIEAHGKSSEPLEVERFGSSSKVPETTSAAWTKVRYEKNGHIVDSSIREGPCREHKTKSRGRSRTRRVDRTGLAVSGNEVPLLSAECLGQTFAPIADSIRTAADPSKDDPATIDSSRIRMTEIVDKRVAPYGVDYRCEFEPVWLSVDLIRKT